MISLPDAAWWNSVEFRLDGGSSSSPGFSMSREEMSDLLRMARNMVELIGEQFQMQREMVDIRPPADDPASHGYLGEAVRDHRAGARGAGDAYYRSLRQQGMFLNRLITKLQTALATVESVDYDGLSGIRQISDALGGDN